MIKSTVLLVAIASSFAVAAPSTAISKNTRKFLTISSIETREIKSAPATADEIAMISGKNFSAMSTQPPVNLGDADRACAELESKGIKASSLELSQEDLSQIITYGQKLWKMIEDNKPVVNVKTDSVAVIPVKAECWRWLTGWQNPVAKTYQVVFKNLYGIKVVKFNYKLIYLYGGSFRGQGQYLARVALVPETVGVMWGYTFNADVSIPTVVNYGTVQSPVAGVEVELQYTVDTVINHYSSTANFMVKGNGEGFAL